ncbi:MAG: dethiobiotin synthase [Bacteroidota bacterium]
MKHYFITGIGTEVGKTVASAVLVQALQTNYWKPVQCGDLDWSDSHKIEAWVSHPVQIFPETHRLFHPMSPHAAAKRAGVEIQLTDFQWPQSDRPILVEGAGGLLVPLNQQDLMLDLIRHLQIEVIVVSRHYLGSINHTLLTMDVLKKAGLPVKGLLFNGDENPDTESIIERHIGADLVLGHLPNLPTIDPTQIAKAAEHLRGQPNFNL